MRLKFAEIFKADQPVHLQEQMDIRPLVKDHREIVDAEPLSVDLRAKNVAGVVDVRGRISTMLELVCSRCLTRFQQALDLPFHEIFSPEPAETGEDGEKEDEEVHYVADDKVDLKPYIEETLLLGLPYIPLCSEACKGLCPVCGGDRNVHDCHCQQERIDPRWEGLAQFFKQ